MGIRTRAVIGYLKRKKIEEGKAVVTDKNRPNLSKTNKTVNKADATTHQKNKIIVM